MRVLSCRLGSLIVTLIALLILASPAKAQQQIGAGIEGQTSLTLLKFDSRKLIDDLANSAINSLSASISATIPMGDFFDKAIRDTLRQVYQGFACLIPSFQFDASLNVPSTLTIQLPCKKISFNLSYYIRQAITAVMVKGTGVAMAEAIMKCIDDPEYASASAFCQFVVKDYREMNTVALVGWSNDYTTKNYEEIRSEVQENAKLYGTPTVIFSGQTPEETQVNVGVGRTRYGTLVIAGKSYGYIPMPDGTRQAKDLPEYLKPVYSYRVNKQVLRDSIIAGFGKLIEQYRVQLAQAKVMIDGVCNATYSVPVLAPGGVGGLSAPDFFSSPSPLPVAYAPLDLDKTPAFLGNYFSRLFRLTERFGARFAEYENYLKKLLFGQLTVEDMLKHVAETRGLTSFVPANPDTVVYQPGSRNIAVLLEQSEDLDSDFSCEDRAGNEAEIIPRGTGCPCPAVSSVVWKGVATVQQTIGASTSTIMSQIQAMQVMLATVISMESWGIRKQIHMESKAHAELIRKVMCAKAQLDYLKIAVELAKMEIQMGLLQTEYSKLSNQERELFEKAKEALKELHGEVLGK